MRPRIGSMCTGYGGLETAVHEVFDGTVAWHAEIDPDASKVLAYRFPWVPNLGDITATDWPAVERVDIVTAGFPCQDISYAGRGAGIKKGNRSGLWHHIADALGVLRPRLVVLENVAAIVARRPGLDVVLADLAALGLDAEWTCVRASDVGASHGRDRWFLVAHPQGERPVWSLRARRGRPGSADRGVAAADTAGDGRRKVGSWPDGDRRGFAANHNHEPAADTDRNGLQGQRGDSGTGQGRATSPAVGCGPTGGNGAAADAYSEAVRQQPEPQSGSSSAPLAQFSDVDWGRFEPAIRRWERIFGRPAPLPREHAPRSGGERLSPPFVEWMQGLPAGFVTGVPGISRNAQLRILGNGVVPQQAAYGLRILMAHLKEAAA